MTKTGFVIANLFRKKARTSLTMLSIITAFLLFGLLQSVNVLFNAGADFLGTARLITQARVSFTQSLPMRMRAEIEERAGRGSGDPVAVVRRRVAGQGPAGRARGRSAALPRGLIPSGFARSAVEAVRRDPHRHGRRPQGGRPVRRGRSARRCRSAPTSSRRRTAARTGCSIWSASSKARTRSGSVRPRRSGSTTAISTKRTSSAAAPAAST